MFKYLQAKPIIGKFLAYGQKLDASNSGYLVKPYEAAKVIGANGDVARGKGYLAIDLAHKMALWHGSASPFNLLSPREFEVSLLFRHGLCAEEMTMKMCVSS